MNKFLIKPLVLVCMIALLIGGAAYSYASFTKNNKKDQRPETVSVPLDVVQEQEQEPANSVQVQSTGKPSMQNVSYEQQAEMIKERQARRNDFFQQSDTR